LSLQVAEPKLSARRADPPRSWLLPFSVCRGGAWNVLFLP
jgi:hypothetical protein